MSRGNYRRDIFETPGAAQSFVGALETGVARHGWRLQAYVLMRNHFHLVLQTPEPNLAQGMHWLLGTVATRFNRYRKERGHLFQGRFQSLPIEDGRVMSRVIDYVHLNPVRAKIVAPAEVASYRWSSLNRFTKGEVFAGLEAAGSLEGRGWADTAVGWSGYVGFLVELAGNLEEQRRLGFEGFSSGWAIGSNDWRRALAKEQAAALVGGLASAEATALREARWRMVLDRHLYAQQRSMEDAIAARKGAKWKLMIAQAVRAECGAAVSWLSRELKLGADGAGRSRLSELRRRKM